jgi:hypothetical protein
MTMKGNKVGGRKCASLSATVSTTQPSGNSLQSNQSFRVGSSETARLFIDITLRCYVVLF